MQNISETTFKTESQSDLGSCGGLSVNEIWEIKWRAAKVTILWDETCRPLSCFSLWSFSSPSSCFGLIELTKTHWTWVTFLFGWEQNSFHINPCNDALIKGQNPWLYDDGWLSTARVLVYVRGAATGDRARRQVCCFWFNIKTINTSIND